MTGFEYKVVPAPTKGQKARGVRKAPDKFAFAVQELMNEMAQDRWEFLRSETLPHEERSGLTSTTTTYRTVLVFRRSNGLPIEEAPVMQTLVEDPVEAASAEPEPAEEKAPEPTPPVEEEALFDDAKIDPVTRPNNLPAALRSRATQVKGEASQDDQDFAAE
jgi:hypothetical protein